jgi:hypothetical protein
MSSAQWYYRLGNVECGPVATDELMFLKIWFCHPCDIGPRRGHDSLGLTPRNWFAANVRETYGKA